MATKPKLELTWIGKENRPRLEPRILLEESTRSYHAAHRVTEHDLFDNRLIFGDNLLALKALEQEFTGKIKCIYIDPPYNTGAAFTHYDDGVEHSLWLSLMRDRIELMRMLLSDDGSIWVNVDDNEGHYLKVLMDEVLGRTNFVATVIWQKLHARNNSAQYLSADHDFVLVYARDITKWKRDLVLDSFAGSGTTGAVAHKMGRRWIMVELGEHCHTHVIPRLRKVIDGQDPGGVAGVTGWKGGGGFRYFRMAPSLLEKDRWGNWVVSKEYNGAMLAEALCKLEGFTYAPSETVYWQHGHSTERDFIYVTTQSLSRQRLAALSEEVGDERSLLVYCMAFRGGATAFANLTVKKIPNAILQRCEWGRDDYSLQVAALPPAPDGERPPPVAPLERRRRSPAPALPLFEGSV